MAKYDDRRKAIDSIVRSSRIRTQKELAEQLKARGFDCTQATISRDISEMGLQKTSQGFYMLPQEKRLVRMLSEVVSSIEDAGNMVVVKTEAASAQAAAEVIDKAGFDGFVGSVAGDNTILIVAKNDESAVGIAQRLEELRQLAS